MDGRTRGHLRGLSAQIALCWSFRFLLRMLPWRAWLFSLGRQKPGVVVAQTGRGVSVISLIPVSLQIIVFNHLDLQELRPRPPWTCAVNLFPPMLDAGEKKKSHPP